MPVSELLKLFPVVIEIPIAWGEMDALQHVNNAVYLRYMESGRMAYFERVGIMEMIRSTGIGPILHSVNCRFRIPLTHPDTVSVGTRIAELGEDRFTMESLIVSHAHGRAAAEAQSVIVVLDYNRQKKAPIPDSLRARIQELEAASQQPERMPAVDSEGAAN